MSGQSGGMCTRMPPYHRNTGTRQIGVGRRVLNLHFFYFLPFFGCEAKDQGYVLYLKLRQGDDNDVLIVILEVTMFYDCHLIISYMHTFV